MWVVLVCEDKCVKATIQDFINEARQYCALIEVPKLKRIHGLLRTSACDLYSVYIALRWLCPKPI